MNRHTLQFSVSVPILASLLFGCNSGREVGSSLSAIHKSATRGTDPTKSVPVRMELGSRPPEGRNGETLKVSSSEMAAGPQVWEVNAQGNEWLKGRVEPEFFGRCRVVAVIRYENSIPRVHSSDGTPLQPELLKVIESKVPAGILKGDSPKNPQKQRILVLRFEHQHGPGGIFFNFNYAQPHFIPDLWEESTGDLKTSWRFISVSVPSNHRYANVQVSADATDVSQSFDPRREVLINVAGRQTKCLGIEGISPKADPSTFGYYSHENWHSIIKFEGDLGRFPIYVSDANPRPMTGDKIGFVNSEGVYEMEFKHPQAMGQSRSERPGAIFWAGPESVAKNVTVVKGNLRPSEVNKVSLHVTVHGIATLKNIDLDPHLQ